MTYTFSNILVILELFIKFFFIIAHLVSVSCGSGPIYWKKSLMENLTFGAVYVTNS